MKTMRTQRLDKNREKIFALRENNGKIKKLEKELLGRQRPDARKTPPVYPKQVRTPQVQALFGEIQRANTQNTHPCTLGVEKHVRPYVGMPTVTALSRETAKRNTDSEIL